MAGGHHDGFAHPDIDRDMPHHDMEGHRQRMEEDMMSRHTDMLTRREERYRSRASSASFTDEQHGLFNSLLEEYISKEKAMMESRVNAKASRMRPSGDMRDPEVKEQFKADLRKSIDERKEADRALRDEVRDFRKQLDDMLNAHPRADL